MINGGRCPQAHGPQTNWNLKADEADPAYHQPVTRMSASWSHPITIKLSTTLSKLGHTILTALACCGCLCLAKQ